VRATYHNSLYPSASALAERFKAAQANSSRKRSREAMTRALAIVSGPAQERSSYGARTFSCKSEHRTWRADGTVEASDSLDTGEIKE